MTTMGLRGVLAGAFIVSGVLLTGMATLPSGAAASELYVDNEAASSTAEPGLFDRFKSKACQISLAATRRDRSSARDRSRECGQ